MKKKIDSLEISLILFIVLLAVFTGITAYNNMSLFMIECPVAVIAIIYGLYRLLHVRKDSREFLRYISSEIGGTQSDALIDFPIPVLVLDENQHLIWSNSFFHEDVAKNDELFGLSASEIFEGFELKKTFCTGGCTISFHNNIYAVYGTTSTFNNETLYALYFVNKSNETKYKNMYEESRPTVLTLVLDNLEDLTANCKESEKTRIIADIGNLFEEFATKNHALIKRYEHSKYVAVLEEKYFKDIVENRFSLLDEAKKITTSEGNSVTVSIGAANGEYSLDKLADYSAAALEMALGRGGDQAALKTKNGYEFFGGFAQGVEKRTKVRTRVVATALSDLIQTCSNIYVMGHRLGDLDCIGAGIAMASACQNLGKSAYLVVNRESCLALPLIEKTEKEGLENLFITPTESLSNVDDNTLLIILDTHIKTILESPELYEKCKNIVVIDHHRRMVGSIDNAVIFFHEPHASSASEMVSELLQYFDAKSKISKVEAEALLSGIILDTKSFSMRCGVRTFEAAAYLKKMGADTIKVKHLFNSTLESYQKRSNIVSSAKIYKNCAIALYTGNYDNISIVAPQAADELLNIEGVDSSFVMFKTETGVSFCARSLGNINVQIIMETLGGGGHQTMAGAQLKDITPKEATAKLTAAIDDYYKKLEGHSEQNP